MSDEEEKDTGQGQQDQILIQVFQVQAVASLQNFPADILEEEGQETGKRENQAEFRLRKAAVDHEEVTERGIGAVGRKITPHDKEIDGIGLFRDIHRGLPVADLANF